MASRAKKKAKARVANEPKNHHYVPAGYIGLFADPPQRDGLIHVWDNRRRKAWKEKPEKVACEEDFYRIEGDDPLAVEKFLREAERSALGAIRAIDQENRPPTKEEADEIVSFVALQYTRSPSLRNAINKSASQMAKQTLEIITHSDQAWESTLRGMERDDPSFSREGIPTREEMAKFVRSENTTFNMNRGWLVTAPLGHQDTVFRLIAARQLWFLRVNGPEELMTSNAPVMLSPHPQHPPIFGVSPGMADAISMPLTPRLLFVARESLEPGTPMGIFMSAPQTLVRTVNLFLANQSEQVYSRLKWKPP